ncbi:MAG: hypothetical protein RAK24_02030 [TACK group archaeon]|nr:hypothetical protein [TACK group archaeon]
MKTLTKWVKEGEAWLLAPATNANKKSSIPFYNANSDLARDISLAVLISLGARGLRVADAMTGVGIRAIRYAMAGADVVANDLAPSSLDLALESSRRNGVSDRILFQSADAREFLYASSNPNSRFDLVDIDPFGSPAPYVDAGLAATKAGGILAVTATDLATLCGHYPTAALEKYGALPLRSEFSHETALRLLISYIYRRARLQGMHIRPMLSFYADHYIRTFVRVEAHAIPEEGLAMGFLAYSRESRRRRWGLEPMVPLSAGEEVAGPLWLGKMWEREFVGRVMDAVVKRPSSFSRPERSVRLMSAISKELDGLPFFYTLSSILGGNIPKTAEVISKLKESGIQASGTHFDGQGIRFNPGDKDPKIFLKDALAKRTSQGIARRNRIYFSTFFSGRPWLDQRDFDER